MKKHFLLFLALLTFTASLYPQTKPKLVILLVVDQMRGDYLERFASEFTGGYRRLISEGVVYTNADLNYAASETGPGHATLATGSYPARNGIVGNEWINRQTRKEMYCVTDSSALPIDGKGGWASPTHLLVTGIGDWLKAHAPSSKVFSLSIKDRAAVLMGGKKPDYVFWYDSNSGAMVSSTYYMRSLPAYVTAFNRSGWIDKYVPDRWEKLLPDSVYERFGPDEFEGEGKWNGSTTFPHAFAEGKKAAQLITSPFGDLMLLAFAQEIVKAERLGQRSTTDLLAIGLSCSDYVGHFYGPNSHEIHDHFVRVDRALGDFFKFLDEHLGAGTYLVALSADHGVCPLPEYSRRVENRPARRLNLYAKTDSLFADLARQWNSPQPLVEQRAFLNYATAAAIGIDSLTLEQRVRSALLSLDGVVDVFFHRELLDPATPDRPFLSQFRNSYRSDRGEDFQLLTRPYDLVSNRSTGTTHGTAHRYDTHVPVVFWWGGTLAPTKSDRRIATVDVAPTVARLIGIPVPSWVDGAAFELPRLTD